MAQSIITRRLSDEDIFFELITNPPLEPEKYRFSLNRAQASGHEAGTLRITDHGQEKIQLISDQTAEQWGLEVPHAQIFIAAHRPNNVRNGLSYLGVAIQRGYRIQDGRMVFEYGGNTSNPDALSWDAAFVEVNEGRLELIFDRSKLAQEGTQLQRWLSPYVK